MARVTNVDAVRLSRAIYGIHRKSRYHTGTTSEGQLHLMTGGTIGGPGGMPFEVGMYTYSCCSACHHATGVKDAWPCDTVKVLLEAGALVDIEDLTEAELGAGS